MTHATKQEWLMGVLKDPRLGANDHKIARAFVELIGDRSVVTLKSMDFVDASGLPQLKAVACVKALVETGWLTASKGSAVGKIYRMRTPE